MNEDLADTKIHFTKVHIVLGFHKLLTCRSHTSADWIQKDSPFCKTQRKLIEMVEMNKHTQRYNTESKHSKHMGKTHRES